MNVSGGLLLLVDGHGKGQLRGLASHPTDADVYATVGDDAFVRVCTRVLNSKFVALATSRFVRNVC